MKKLLLITATVALIAGCHRETIEYPIEFERNLVHAMKYEIKEGIPMTEASKDAYWIVDRFFGTPDAPKIPELLADPDFEGLFTQENLDKAAGPVREGGGLYRKHCVTCHGITGNGRGENASTSTPYPRDYRMGIFKFKSTARGAKPTRDDLVHTILEGLPGSTMVKIRWLADDGTEATLTKEDAEALAEYVIYLSMRGNLERMLIDDAIFELDLEGGDRIVDREFGASLDGDGRTQVEEAIAKWEAAGEPKDAPGEALSEKLELYDEAIEIAQDMVADMADSWLEAEDEIIEVPEPPTDFPVSDSHEHFVTLMSGDQADALKMSVKRGQEVFLGKIASCSKCHGEKGLGNGQTNDYDDWTKDWTERAGLKPEDTDALVPLMARGALPPKNALPRNFSEGLFRGGDSAETLYRRILEGIEGSPMPKATFVEGQYEETDIWHLINFIRSLQKTESTDG